MGAVGLVSVPTAERDPVIGQQTETDSIISTQIQLVYNYSISKLIYCTPPSRLCFIDHRIPAHQKLKRVCVLGRCMCVVGPRGPSSDQITCQGLTSPTPQPTIRRGQPARALRLVWTVKLTRLFLFFLFFYFWKLKRVLHYDVHPTNTCRAHSPRTLKIWGSRYRIFESESLWLSLIMPRSPVVNECPQTTHAHHLKWPISRIPTQDDTQFPQHSSLSLFKSLCLSHTHTIWPTVTRQWEDGAWSNMSDWVVLVKTEAGYVWSWTFSRMFSQGQWFFT